MNYNSMNQNLYIFVSGLQMWWTLFISMHGKPISQVDITKDLGIILTSNLSWNHHYNLILGKIYKFLCMIRQSFTTNLVPVKKKLYISLITSQLLYCSQVWCPFLIKDILLLEHAHSEKSNKIILNDYHSSYKSRLLSLKLLSLMYIYEINDIMFLLSLTNLHLIILRLVIISTLVIKTLGRVPLLK